MSYQNNNYIEPKAFAAWSLDCENRFKSTSGGIFTELGKSIICQGGIVFGAKYITKNSVGHVMATTIEELYELRQSKYVQSNTGEIYKIVKSKLNQNVLVCFVGTPCQVAGLYMYLGKEYKNLFTVDFICRGVNSPKALIHWIKEIEVKNCKEVKKVWFKYKENGWKKSPLCTRVDFSDESFRVYDQKKNDFMVGYLGPNLYVRPSCTKCMFKGTPRWSDITVADFWGIEEQYNDDKGTSLVLVNNDFGNHMLCAIKNKIKVDELPFYSVAKHNKCINESINMNPMSYSFLRDLDSMSFSKALHKYNKKPLYVRVINRLLRVLRR